jgi:serine/threonine protein kinase
VKSIRDDPVPQLPAVQPSSGRAYSADFRDLIEQCLQKDAARRPTAAALLKHEFLRDADRCWSESLAHQPVLHQLMSPTDTDRADLDAILVTIYRAQYANGRAEYRKSLMELARFQKLAENLNNRHISVAQIQARFEDLYRKLKAQEGK